MEVVLSAWARRIIAEKSNANDSPKAVGVELVDGRKYHGKTEVIMTCGAYRTPQVLLLSGIGPATELAKLSIPQIVDLPVGQNLHDHVTVVQYWKVKHPEKGIAAGSPAFNEPAYQHGLPCDWLLTESVPADKVKAAFLKDGVEIDEKHSYFQGRGHFEGLINYAPPSTHVTGMAEKVPFDGAHISAATCMFLPTSRGTVTLASLDVRENPVIDP